MEPNFKAPYRPGGRVAVRVACLPCFLWKFINAEISILPSNLKYLSVNDTYISDFNNYLPDSLESLFCLDCDIHQLPSKLPIKLKYLDCSNNFLRVLPNLPNSLESLRCQNNKIKLIRYLPENLKSFLYDNNPGLEIDTKLPRGISK